MSDHDHLEPLPEATPRIMVGMFVGGVVTGVVALLLDVWVTQALLGFESPYIVFSLAVMAIFVISGSMKDNSLGVVLPLLGGIAIGVFTMNAVRVHGFSESSMLAGIGL